jgi:hypothetical protein
MVQFRVKIGALTTPKKIRKTARFHNAKLRFFLLKYTISCGRFSLPAKRVVDGFFLPLTQAALEKG